MVYYKVKKEFDGYTINKGYKYIANELHTEKEVEKLGVDKTKCDKIEVSKNRTYIMFGARFGCKHYKEYKKKDK